MPAASRSEPPSDPPPSEPPVSRLPADLSQTLQAKDRQIAELEAKVVELEDAGKNKGSELEEARSELEALKAKQAKRHHDKRKNPSADGQQSRPCVWQW